MSQSRDDGDAQARYQRLLQRIEANEGEFRRLGRAVWRVQEDERRRLARELHDGIGQNLTALKHRLALIGSELGADHEGLRARVEAAIELCASTLEDTRELSRLLRPPILDDLGLAPALRWLARNVEAGGGPEVELDLDPPDAIEQDLQTLLFRFVQEALNNAAKHAGARTARVCLRTGGGMLRLRVEDDGRGFDPARTEAEAGSGLGGMRERLRLYGGHFAVESSPGSGTCVEASIALDR
jgi:signal transduction histidine kinase